MKTSIVVLYSFVTSVLCTEPFEPYQFWKFKTISDRPKPIPRFGNAVKRVLNPNRRYTELSQYNPESYHNAAEHNYPESTYEKSLPITAYSDSLSAYYSDSNHQHSYPNYRDGHKPLPITPYIGLKRVTKSSDGAIAIEYIKDAIKKGLRKIERGLNRLTNTNYIQRQGFLGVPPILSFVGFTTAIATFGVAHQLGITDEIARTIDQIINKEEAVASAKKRNGGWSDWEAWATGCSVNVGAGTTQTRYRKCTNPTPSGGGAECSGDNGQTLTCSAQGTVTQIISFSNSRISTQAFNDIKDKIKIGLSEASGHHPDLITLNHVDGNSFFTVTYVIYDDTTKAALKSTIDDTGYVTTLRTELSKQSINLITITTVAASEDVNLDATLIAKCSNGIKEVDEDGIDCGNVCIIACQCSTFDDCISVSKPVCSSNACTECRVNGAVGTGTTQGDCQDGSLCQESGQCTEKPNVCDTNNGGCEQTCTNNLGVALCTCVTGSLNDDNMSCDGDNNPCETSNWGCEHKCTWPGTGSATCSCVSGTLNPDLMNCDGDTNPCDANNGGCEHTCTNTRGVAVCTCMTGHLNSDNLNCDEDNSPCDASNGGCEHTCTWRGTGTATCSCVSGTLNGDNMKCDGDTNPCDTDNGGCEHTCTNTRGVAVCACLTGNLNTDLRNCDGDTNPCDTKNGECEHICTSIRGAAVCSCESGDLNSDAKTCDGDSSPCETDNAGCEHTCTWRGSGSATCSCVSGVLNADNMNCDGDDAMCTVDKVMVVSGPDSNRGVRTNLEETASQEACDDGSLNNKTCFELNKTFFKNFRTLGGHCNCLSDPMNGAKGDRLSRLLPGDHTRFDKPTFFTKPDDNLCDTLTCASSCEEESERLPKPRQVSIVIAEKDDTNKLDNNLSSLAIIFGQFLTHDISLTPETQLDESCCEQNNDECMQIELPSDDPFYSPLNKQCFSLTRSLPHCSSGFPPSKIREQQTVITAFLDLSNVYGSDVERSLRVREMVKGEMKVTEKNNLLSNEEYQLCMVPVSGDVRAMENPSLASLHTLFMREHNRICKELWNLSSVDWTKFGGPECDSDHCDEWIYQNARRILVAEWQNIIYSEWLPSFLGESRMNDFHLGLDENRPYNNSADPSILSSFSTAAFRFGHSMINGIFTKKNPSNQAAIRDIPLSDTFFNTEEYQGNGAEQLLAGLWDKKAQARDRFVTTQMTNFLFKDGANFGQDLIARNIARGRDHGIPSFAKFYSKVGPESDPNRDLKCWGNIPQAFDARTWELLKKVYNHPQDIDLFVGGMAEQNTVGGGVLGNTFGWIVAEQFRLLKDGDRFFFTQPEHDHSFTTQAINAIKRRKLSDILCDNTKLRTVGSDAFLSTSEEIECSDSASRNALNLADINLLLPSDVAGGTYLRTNINQETSSYLPWKQFSGRLSQAANKKNRKLKKPPKFLEHIFTNF